MNLMYHVYELMATEHGRIVELKLAEFVDATDAQVYAKNRAFKKQVNMMIVYPKGNISIHSDRA